jgi:hypothetical protein
MAKLRLSRRRVEEGNLPTYCMRCGEPTELIKHKNFSWHPEWVDIFIVIGVCAGGIFWVGIILAIVLTKRMRVTVPLCEQHQNHWRWRRQMIWFSLMVPVGLLICGIGLAFALHSPPGNSPSPAAILALAMAGVAFVVWIIIVAALQNSAIRAKEITDDGITLIKVSPEFVRCFAEQRRSERESREEFDEEDDDEVGRQEPDVRIRPQRLRDRDFFREK